MPLRGFEGHVKEVGLTPLAILIIVVSTSTDPHSTKVNWGKNQHRKGQVIKSVLVHFILADCQPHKTI